MGAVEVACVSSPVTRGTEVCARDAGAKHWALAHMRYAIS